MLKEQAVASLGESSLLLPAWVKSALAANDRLKLYLTLLQSAAQQASHPGTVSTDWTHELASTGLSNAQWLRDLVKSAYFNDGVLVLPQFEQLLVALAADLTLMARPLCEGQAQRNPELTLRRDHWLHRLQELGEDEGLTAADLTQLTHGNRHVSDSLHLLVMDLHKQLNALASTLATEEIDGAHAWQIAPEDRPLVQAFMRGLNRTAPLKFSHPGLDTAVTRDGSKLLIQNDIGTNDAHVLVLEVQELSLSLNYSDLHSSRFDFFCQLLTENGFAWQRFDPVTHEGLNQGKPYHMGRGTLHADTPAQLQRGLETVGASIVFVIDWNRARKKLQTFVRKPQAVRLLQEAAHQEWGHMAWLLAGGERLVYNAMQAVDSEAFRIGDRLDEVIGDSAAFDYLRELLHLSSTLLRQQQPLALVADEARLLLARMLRQRTFEFDLLAEHAAYCHALAQQMCELLEAGGPSPQESATSQNAGDHVQRAKAWERRADHLLMDARQRAERQPRWRTVVALLEKADDVADALEEATFIHELSSRPPLAGLPGPVTQVLGQLANATLAAIQDLVRAIEIGRHMNASSDRYEGDAFLQTLWRMLRAERLCDELLRQARQTIVQHLHQRPADMLVANDLAATLENATDSLLGTGFALRQMVFTQSGISS